ncbi:hypothetical protein C900_03922 [Fulvivirga imtechensis AK7]|uniref:Uncharacterized protein n=1 Tax=Fulvivirga imtechensis AK7 TaxID=1237149 RepID=L8JSB1_9BACT|nr:hypothetical protein C900_03922 [Fulvivirga imtechensis AK7]
MESEVALKKIHDYLYRRIGIAQTWRSNPHLPHYILITKAVLLV